MHNTNDKGIKEHKVFDEHNLQGPSEDDLQSGETAAERFAAAPKASVTQSPGTRLALKAIFAISFTPDSPTEGERRVRTTFNASGANEITNIKQSFAQLIDSIHYSILPNPHWNDATSNEFARNKAVCISAIEKAAMYAVKAATTENS